MNNLITTSRFEKITNFQIDEHIFELYTNHPPPESRNLGYINRSNETINAVLKHCDIDLTIRQSFSGSSTGFLCWNSSLLLTDWLISDEKCPFHNIFKQKSNLTIVELGAGVGGVCVSILGPLVKRFISTDQRDILKLLKQNFLQNVTTDRYVSSTLGANFPEKKVTGKNLASKAKSKSQSTDDYPVIDFIEYDWEYLDAAFYNYLQVTSDHILPDLIIACDTIYNEYLIPHFISAFKKLMGTSTGVLIGIQLRDENILQLFLEEVCNSNLNLFSIPIHMLSKELLDGYVVYYITL